MRRFFVDICLEVEAEDEDSAWQKVNNVAEDEKFKLLLEEYNIHDDDVTVSEPSETWE